jgi:hypothetical protein
MSSRNYSGWGESGSQLPGPNLANESLPGPRTKQNVAINKEVESLATRKDATTAWEGDGHDCYS